MRLRSSIAPYFMIKHDQRDRDYSVQSVVAFGAVIGRQLIQNFANPPAQLGNLERLRQKWDSGDPIGVQCLSIACYQQRFESRLAGLRALHNGRAIHFGHGIINEQQVDRPLPFEDLQGKGGIVCGGEQQSHDRTGQNEPKPVDHAGQSSESADSATETAPNRCFRRGHTVDATPP
jgi:hypothetical protein